MPFDIWRVKFDFRFVLLLLILLLVDLSASNKKRHIIFIVADDWGWGDYGIHGLNEIQTPNLDALAYAGVTLNNYYTAYLCTPSRASLMTGFHPAHIGMQHDVLNAGERSGLPLSYKILPQFLKDEGYKTHAVGKWHLGHFKKEYTPLYRGFDYHFGYWEGRQGYYNHLYIDRGRNVSGYDMRRGMNISWSSYQRYSTHLFTDDAINTVRNHDPSAPLFLYIAHLAVHGGNSGKVFEAPVHTINRFRYIDDPNRRTFAAMLWEFDQSVGKIVAALGRNNMLSDSILVLTTDNGGATHPYDNSRGSNWPLRGGKGSYWEGGVRGNAVVWAADLPASKIEKHLMHIQDWVPTLLGAINSDQLKDNSKFDGKNLWPVLKGEQDLLYDDVILQADPSHNSFAYRQGDYKILRGRWILNNWYNLENQQKVPAYNLAAVEGSLVAQTLTALNFRFPSPILIQELRKKLRVHCTRPKNGTQQHKDVECNPRNETCLFNLKNDPCEMNNLAKAMPDKLISLKLQMKKFNATSPIKKISDPLANPRYWNNTHVNWCDYIKCEENIPLLEPKQR